MWLKKTRHGDLLIPAKMVRVIHSAAEDCDPLEACGLLLGKAGRITVARQARNVHPTPETHFEIDPQALIDAHRAQREGGLRVMGYFHSHPTGDPYPSETDREQSVGDEKVWAIAAGDGLMFWQDSAQGFHALSYDIIGR